MIQTGPHVLLRWLHWFNCILDLKGASSLKWTMRRNQRETPALSMMKDLQLVLSASGSSGTCKSQINNVFITSKILFTFKMPWNWVFYMLYVYGISSVISATDVFGPCLYLQCCVCPSCQTASTFVITNVSVLVWHQLTRGRSCGIASLCVYKNIFPPFKLCVSVSNIYFSGSPGSLISCQCVAELHRESIKKTGWGDFDYSK